MKNFILQVLHYLYIKRDDIFVLYKDIRKDWKIWFDDFKTIVEYYKNSWFIPEENDEVFVWWITKLKKNTSKNIVQYNQSNLSCAIYSKTRTAMYNIKGLVYSKDEVESIVNLAIEKGYLKKTWKLKGMTFANADKVITEWTLKNKWIQLKYDKVVYGGSEDKKRAALWYWKGIGGWISWKYISDFRIDWEVNEEYSFNEKILYYHAFTKEADGLLTENYPTQFWNNNRYENDLVKDFMNHKVFFQWSYYIFSEDEIKEDKIEEMKTNLFTDVDWSANFYESIKWAKENGVVNGYSDGSLRPKENLTVDRFLAILHNYDKQSKK